MSLMVPLRMQTSLVLVRPFEFLVAFGLLGWPLMAARRGVRFPLGFLLLLPYFFDHVASAAAGGPKNVAREGLQVVVVTLFAFFLAQETRRIEMHRLSRRLLVGMAAIATGTIAWHLSHGYLVGWKQLPDPRLTYVFLPTLVAGLILFTEPSKRRNLHVVWAAFLPLLVMSGERKALIIYLVLTALLFARGRLALVAPVLAGAFVGLTLLSAVIENPYLQKQINTIIAPGGTGDYQYVIATGRYPPGATPSDVQRAFALHESKVLFVSHPIFGVGTNQYPVVVNKTYPNLPGDMSLSIHGVFQRILSENGLVGLLLYLLIWIASWSRFTRLLRRAYHKGLLTSAQLRVLPLLLFAPFALYLGTEAPGTRAFVGIIVISLLPEITYGVLARRTVEATGFESARPQVAIVSAPGVAG